MTKAIRIHEHGGPEVLRYEDVETGQPGPGQALVRHTAIGVNFIDCYYRTGLYPAPGGLHCGLCDSCRLRSKGFADAGLADPTRYAVRP